jgi:hypothetical protein
LSLVCDLAVEELELASSLRDYLRAAFSARPIGMWIPPNWIGVGAFALLGMVNPGFWVLGAGLELGYLYTLTNNRRFRTWVDAVEQYDHEHESRVKLETLIESLDPDDYRLYRQLEQRCRGILTQGITSDQQAPLKVQADGLSRLLWIYLRLLMTRRSITRALSDSYGAGGERESLEERIARLQKKLEVTTLSEDLRKSLTGQVDILKQRLEKQQQAREKLTFLEAELTRIQEQAELIREQASFSANPEAVSQQIDHVSETLGGTMEWIQEQQQVYGDIEMIAEPPTLTVEPRQKAKEKE